MASIGVYRYRWHVGAELTPSKLVRNTTGNTFAKMAALGLIAEEAVVEA